MDDPNPDPTARVPDPAGGAAAPPPPASPSADRPRRHRHRNDGRAWSLVVGLGIVGLGLWFFAERTLGLDMPVIHWSQWWPVILIAVGALILWGAIRRERP